MYMEGSTAHKEWKLHIKSPALTEFILDSNHLTGVTSQVATIPSHVALLLRPLSLSVSSPTTPPA